MQNLSRTELTRYSRNILLPEIGKEGQLKLKNARVSVIGAGGLGSPVLLYLAAAGIGHLTVIDSDTVDLTNLQRQVLFQTDSVGRKKASEAEGRIHQINPHLNLSVFDRRLTPETVSDMLSPSDLVIEGSDNFMTKFLVNDFCFHTDK
ncbi:MAG TPA: HesA/MoeB/ThiF family protein, partial [Leptospiraceae bacterium]|nr:HesA/MoeB/ThiF family protein [Leptospiraceae bacterium]